jgi:hypothetical protein
MRASACAMLSFAAATSPMRTIVSPTRTPERCAGPEPMETTTKPLVDGSMLIPIPENLDAVS